MDLLSFLYYRDLYHFVPVCHTVLKAIGFGQDEQIEEQPSLQCAVSFNYDCSSIVAGRSEGGIAIYTIDEFAVNHLKTVTDASLNDLLYVEQVLATDFYFTISRESPRRLNLFRLRRGRVVHSFLFDSPIKSIKFNRNRFVVTTEESAHLYDAKCFKFLRKFELPNDESWKSVELSSGEESLLVYPSFIDGEIHIFDGALVQHVKSLRIHENPIAKVALNKNGTLLASASRKGTVIRVTDVDSGTVLHTFCRSLVKEALIFSLTFSPDDRFLCTSSETGTVHLFQLTETGSIMSGLTKFASYMIPSLQPLERPKSMASLSLGDSDEKTKIVLKDVNDQLHVFVLSADSRLQIFRYDENSVVPKIENLSEQVLS